MRRKGCTEGEEGGKLRELGPLQGLLTESNRAQWVP